ncbi:MAG TPA: SBBP repeat-containing protein, partial [Flavipsychrobacter sp.]|nr:SBBP repeat-containing protein [Flavipsychrobacter sp.]
MKKALLALLCTLLCTNLTAQNFSWAKSLSGLDADDARAMTLDNEGNVLVTGYFSDSIDADPGAGVLNMAPQGGTYDFLIQKLTPSGDLIWARQISGTAEEYANAIITDANGGIYLTGIFEDTVDFDPSVGTDTLISAGMNDIFILHLDSAGQFVWVKQIGGTENDYGFDVDVDAAGNIYVVGNFNSNAGIDFDPGPGVEMRFTALSNWDAFTLKLDSNGDFIWVKQTFGAVYDAGQSVEIDNSGNVYTVGAVATRVFVQKLAPDATNIWLRDFGALDFNTVQNNKGKLDPFGNLFISGTFSNTVDFDSGVAV